jgi:hypothetical protein
MDFSQTIAKIREIRNNVDGIYEEVIFDTTLNVDIDDRRAAFFLSELDSLISVLLLSENGFFKESLSIIRNTLEKYFFLWLMMKGKKYKHKFTYTIIPNAGRSPQVARDETLRKWQEAKENGTPAYEEITKIKAGKHSDEITVEYEFSGLYNSSDKLLLQPPIPRYNFVLYEFDPETKYLANLPSISDGDMFPDIFRQESKLQNQIHKFFFGFDSIRDNLKLNGLISEEQEEKILVHYNFLSGVVHNGKNNIDFWLHRDTHYIITPMPDQKIEPEILSELVLLYTAKMFHLYLDLFVKFYAGNNIKFDGSKYDQDLKDLENISKDLWFFDNQPTQYDLESSKKRKAIAFATGHTQQTGSDLYYKNPYQRLVNLRIYQKTGHTN